jgi:hypothetical protein
MRRRTVINLIVFLLLGATVNIAVAWTLAACPRRPVSYATIKEAQSCNQPPFWRLEQSAAFGIEKAIWTPVTRSFAWFGNAPGLDLDLGLVGARELADAPAWCRIDWREPPPEELECPLFYVLESAAGWPLLAATSLSEARLKNDGVMLELTSQSGFVLRRAVPFEEGLHDFRLLPLRPIWPGFAINSVVYATLLWVLRSAPFAMRRRWRIRRGLCPKCAYPMGRGEVCTECGSRLV